MTTIKATCPGCGEVALTPTDIELRVDRDEQQASYYAFSCPRCTREVRKPADDRVVRLLLSGGVPAMPLEQPEPLVKPSIAFDGPALTLDDLLDLHALLETDGWFDELSSLVRS